MVDLLGKAAKSTHVRIACLFLLFCFAIVHALAIKELLLAGFFN